MHEQVEVVYENGVFRPVGPLPPQLREHLHLTVTIDTPGTLEARAFFCGLMVAELRGPVAA